MQNFMPVGSGISVLNIRDFVRFIALVSNEAHVYCAGKIGRNSLVFVLSTDCRNPFSCRYRSSAVKIQGHQWIIRYSRL